MFLLHSCLRHNDVFYHSIQFQTCFYPFHYKRKFILLYMRCSPFILLIVCDCFENFFIQVFKFTYNDNLIQLILQLPTFQKLIYFLLSWNINHYSYTLNLFDKSDIVRMGVFNTRRKTIIFVVQ